MRLETNATHWPSEDQAQFWAPLGSIVNCVGAGQPQCVSGHETLMVNIWRAPFLVEENAMVCPSGENVGSKSLNEELVSGFRVLDASVNCYDAQRHAEGQQVQDRCHQRDEQAAEDDEEQ